MKTVKASAENLANYIESPAPAPKTRGRKKKVDVTQTITNITSSSYSEVLEREKQYQIDHASKSMKMSPLEQVRSVLGEVDEVIDQLFKRKKKTTFNLVKWMGDKSFDDKHADIIEGIYAKQKAEIDEMIEGNDPDLKEGYSFLNSYQKKLVQDFYQGLLDQCQEFLNLKRRRKAFDRKPRVAKPVSTAKQVKSLKFKKEDADFKIVSVTPEYIIGASEIWAFNTKYRCLTHYIAKDIKGFGVKGSALVNWDETKSITKTLRTPDETLKIVLEGKKKDLDSLMNSLTTKPSAANGRFNSNIVILKIQK